MRFPIDNFSWTLSVTQLFGQNPQLYSQFSIPGHNGVDIISIDAKRGYGSKIRAAHAGKIARIYSDFPTKTFGTGIYLQQQTPTGFVETIYWHLADVLVAPGDDVKEGQVIGLMGNTGYVVPRPSSACPHCGTHLHFGVREYDSKGAMIQTEYDGYRDPVPYLHNDGDKLPIHFFRDLYLGTRGGDVSWLQTVLLIEKLTDAQPIGVFGPKTLQGVRALQQRYGIAPAYGYVGNKTRMFLNAKYSNTIST